MKTKAIKHIFTPPPFHMVGDGFRVHNFFPYIPEIGKQGMSPFFLLDYNSKVMLSPTDKPRGVGVHPHRGFETVTIAYHGKVAHHDSAGNSGVIAEGDVQWMTAASGVLHKEYHEKEFSKKGGFFQMVQLWVNLPAKYKMSKPKYQEITNKQMSKYELPNNGGHIDIIAGEFMGLKGPAFTFTPIEMYNMNLKKEANIKLNFPEHYNTGILVIEGNATFNESDNAPANNFVFFKNEGEEITVAANEDSVLLVLSGEPIKEPIAAHGPFLMNTIQEIQQAMIDFNDGKFGELAD